jgi:hypothetical protein
MDNLKHWQRERLQHICNHERSMEVQLSKLGKQAADCVESCHAVMSAVQVLAVCFCMCSNHLHQFCHCPSLPPASGTAEMGHHPLLFIF